MAIWTLLRDFFVEYIFGGTSSNGSTTGLIVSGNEDSTTFAFDIGSYSVSMGDWLSTTATVITLIVFVIILFLLLKWLFKVISGFILLK